MKTTKTISLLVLCIAALALIATATGIFSEQGPGVYEYISIRGQTIQIYGKGIYQHMSAEVAPQGIAQDVVTLFIGIPLLLASWYYARKGSFRGRVVFTGTLGYFLVNYLFYLVMGMYNDLFLVYVLLLSCSFFAFSLMMLSFSVKTLKFHYEKTLPVKSVGGYLLFSSVAIGLLWLQIVVPPLLTGTIPLQVEHYTTLIVQGLDLAILLPIAFISGILLIQRKPFGYLLAPVYIVFLSILMCALTAKVIAMALAGYNVFPVVIIIPLFNITAVLCAFLVLKNISKSSSGTPKIFHSNGTVKAPA